MNRGVRRLGGFAMTLALLASCSSPETRITSASPIRIAEGTMQLIALSTIGCAPGFDLDNSRLDADPTASLRLGPTLSFDAMRVGNNAFTAMLGTPIPPGSYPLELVLTDGRRAALDGQFEVVPLDPIITAVASPRSTIAFGESGIPLSISIANPSACAVDRLTIVPTFDQSGARQFDVQGPSVVHLDPNSVGTFDFSVNIGSTAAQGTIQVNATATGGTRSGLPSCMGSVDAVASATGAVWFVVPAGHQSISVTDVQPNPRSVSVGATFTLNATVQSMASVDLTIERMDVVSDPVGVTISPTSPPLAVPLNAGATAIPGIILQAPQLLSARSFTLSVVVTARDAAQGLYVSPTGTTSTTSVMVHPN